MKTTFIKRMVLATGILFFSSSLFAQETDTLFTESFSMSLNDFTPMSMIGEQAWTWSSYGGVGFAKMTGYASGNFANDDWLISPAIDLTNVTNAMLTFQHAHRYGVDVERNLTFLVSTNYGIENEPMKWKPIPFIHSDGASYTFISSGELSLNEYLGLSNIRFAFHYLSTDTACSTWEVKDIVLTGTFEKHAPTPIDVFSESFDGFDLGTLPVPNSTDVSTTLNLFTEIDGWSGLKVYQAGGAVKCGSSSANGSLSTPYIYLSDNGGKFNISFKSMAWSGDTTDLQIFVNGILKKSVTGLPNTASYEFGTFGPIELDGGTDSTIITFAGENVAKAYRFYLDSLVVTTILDTAFTPDPPIVHLTTAQFRGEFGKTVSKELMVKAENLTGPLSVRIMSKDETGWSAFSSSVEVIPAQMAMNGFPLVVHYTPSVSGNDSAIVMLFGGGLTVPQNYLIVGASYNVTEVPNLAALRSAYDANPSDVQTVYRVTGQTIVSFTQPGANSHWVQDATGGIQIYDQNWIAHIGNIGDGIMNLTGTLLSYNGLLEIIPTEDVVVGSTSNMLHPILLTIPQAIAGKETYESMLIQINDMINVSPNYTWLTTKTNYDFHSSNHADTIIIRTNATGLDYMGDTIPYSATNYAGILIEYNGKIQLFPRSRADIGQNIIPIDTTCMSINLTGGSFMTNQPINVVALASGLSVSDHIISYQFDLSYDSNLLDFDNAFASIALSAGGSLVVNDYTEGILHVSYMSTTPLTGACELATFMFNALGTGFTTPIISNFLFNTDTVYNVTTQAIMIEEEISTPGDVDGNGFIQAYDAAITLQYSVGMEPLPEIAPRPWMGHRFYTADVDGSTTITANDAALILQYSAYLIDNFPMGAIGLRSASVDNADVIITQEDGQIIIKSVGNLIGFNLYVDNKLSMLGTPTIINNNMLSAVNITGDTYAIGLATTRAPEEGTTLMTIPINTPKDVSVTFNLVVNSTSKTIMTKIATGLNSHQTEKLAVYPNPVGNTLELIGSEIGSTMRLFDLNGKMLLQKPVTSNHEQMDVSSLSNGVYLLKVISDGNQQILKVIKK